jgi:hypothetical protein
MLRRGVALDGLQGDGSEPEASDLQHKPFMASPSDAERRSSEVAAPPPSWRPSLHADALDPHPNGTRDVVGLQASPKLQSSSGFGHREAPLEGSRVSSVHSVNSALVFPHNAVPTCACSVSCSVWCSGGARSCGLLRVVSCDWSCAGATANCSDKCPAARRHSLSGIWRRRQSRPSGLSLCGRRAEGLLRCMCC